MLNRRSNLPAVQTSKTLAAVTESDAAIVAPGQVPKAVTRGIKEITLAYPAQGLTPEDLAILLGIYLEAVAGFACAVVIWTLRWLLFHNPRNTPSYTTRPTPQDVREACQLTHNYWQRWIVEFYFDGAWAKPSTNLMLTKDNTNLLKRHHEAQKHGKPGEPDCIVPTDLQIEYLRREIARQLPDIENEAKRRAQQFVDAPLLTINDDVLDRMPEAAFPDGALQMIRAKRAARVEAARKAEEHSAYIDSLPDDVRYLRWSVVKSEQWIAADEADIMAETNRRLEIVRTARAKAEAEGGEFLGWTFDDGSEWHEQSFQKFYCRSARRA